MKSIKLKYAGPIATKVVPLIIAVALSAVATLTLIAQDARDAADGRFHDDLLDHLVGRWEVTGVAHGMTDNSTLEAEWVLNHQFLRIYQKSVHNGPGLDVPFECVFFIGYNHTKKHYVANLMTVFGGDQGTDYLMSGDRKGNELKLTFKGDPDLTGVQRFIWEPESKSWHILSSMVNAGKEEAPHLDLKVIPATHH